MFFSTALEYSRCPADHTNTTKKCATADPLLMPLLTACGRGDDASVRTHLERLINVYADPIIAAAVRQYIPGKPFTIQHQAADVRSETVGYLLRRLSAPSIATSTPRNFRALVKITARHMCWKQIKAERTTTYVSSHQSTFPDPDAFTLEDTVATRADVQETVTYREMLQATWDEIEKLPIMQKYALLLNVRGPDGGGGFCLLAAILQASPAEMAALIGVSDLEMAELIPLLPMEDSAIGKRLNVSVRELQNFRIAARRRLRRRLSAWF